MIAEVSACRLSIAFVAAAVMAVAQQYTDESSRLVPPLACRAVVPADFDADGDVDLACLVPGGIGLAWIGFAWNDGAGRFALAPSTFPVYSNVAAAGDIDGDGDIDLVVGGIAFLSYIPGTLLRNDGGGQFTDVSSQWPSVNEATRRIALVDYDSDGDRDLITCNRIVGQLAPTQPIHRLYLNNGGGVFTDATAARLPNLPGLDQCMASGDLDGDSDLDLVFAGAGSSTGSQPAPIRVRLQNAQGVAVETPGLVTPSPAAYWWSDVILRDFDLDGDLDLAAASNSGVQLFSNNGAAQFTVAAVFADNDVVAWAAADIDGDGRVDLIAACADPVSQRPRPGRLYRNTPSGFVDATATAWEASALSPRAVVAVDVDGDLDTDLVGVSAPQLQLWHNDGFGHLLQLAQPAFGDATVTWADSADLEGDGDLDVAAIEEAYAGSGSQVVVVENVGGVPSGNRYLVGQWSGIPRPECLHWVDADGDGDQDLFVGVASGPDALFHRVGSTFVEVTASHMPGTVGSERVVAGDLDADGRTDLLTAGTYARCYRGNAAGGFTDATALFPAPGAYVGDVAVLDFDGDGDLDVVHAMSISYPGNGGVRLLRNDLPAPFVDITPTTGLPVLHCGAVAAIDVDRDGRMDLLAGNNALPGPGVLLFRATTAGFVDETVLRLPGPLVAAGGFVVVDFDGDGDDDVLVSDPWQDPVTLLRNDGGIFVVWSHPVLSPYSLPPVPAVGDFDRDGDQDLVTRTGSLRNVARDLFVGLPPRLGRPGSLVVQAWRGNGVDPQAVVLAMAAQTLPAPVGLGSLGLLRIDPATMAFLAARSVPATGGEATVPFAVPALPSLLGARVFVQGLFLHEPDPASWRFGNAVELQVRL